MSIKRHRIMLALILLIGLAGCRSEIRPTAVRAANANVSFPEQAYQNIPADKGKVYWIDSRTSDVRFFLWRGGLLAQEGHNHVMIVHKMEGAIFMPKNLTENQARFDIVFKAKDIQVDPLDLRRKIGGAFNTGMSEEGAQGTREHMLGQKVLNAQQYPRIGLSSQKAFGEPPKMAFDTRITLHGVQHRYLIPVTIDVQNDRLHARGTFAIKQTDFGIEPYSALGGALYLLDPISVEFSITAQARANP